MSRFASEPAWKQPYPDLGAKNAPSRVPFRTFIEEKIATG